MYMYTKIESVPGTREERKRRTTQKRPNLEEGKRDYVLDCMIVTCPTCQAERSPLKAPALLNTAPHSNKEKSKDKNGLKKKKERAMFKNIISQHKKEEGK